MNISLRWKRPGSFLIKKALRRRAFNNIDPDRAACKKYANEAFVTIEKFMQGLTYSFDSISPAFIPESI